MYSFGGTVHHGNEPADQCCPTRDERPESGICLPSSRGFMDDLTLTTATHVQARWMLAALTDVALWARMKFKAVKSRSLVIKKGQTREIQALRTEQRDPIHSGKFNQVPRQVV